MKEAFHILTIYWFLFIYYSLAAMDEMIELFSVINQLQKGALGLFFELNYLVGAFLAGYTAWFCHKFDVPTTTVAANELNFRRMYNWIFFQYCYLFFCVIMIFVVNGIYRRMNNEARGMKKTVGKEIEMEDRRHNYAVNE